MNEISALDIDCIAVKHVPQPLLSNIDVPCPMLLQALYSLQTIFKVLTILN